MRKSAPIATVFSRARGSLQRTPMRRAHPDVLRPPGRSRRSLEVRPGLPKPPDSQVCNTLPRARSSDVTGWASRGLWPGWLDFPPCARRRATYLGWVEVNGCAEKRLRLRARRPRVNDGLQSSLGAHEGAGAARQSHRIQGAMGVRGQSVDSNRSASNRSTVSVGCRSSERRQAAPRTLPGATPFGAITGDPTC
jgi:hypothetical protein